jgi:hypothetical protein
LYAKQRRSISFAGKLWLLRKMNDRPGKKWGKRLVFRLSIQEEKIFQ